MIKIHTNKDNTVQINISKGTPHQEFLLGIEMLVETLMDDLKEQNINTNIDDLLHDIKLIYVRDKEEK